MTIQSAQSFMEAVRDSRALQDELRKLNPSDMDSILKVAASNHFDAFTKEDYYAAAFKVGGEWTLWAAQMRNMEPPDDKFEGELDDTALESISGGKACNNCYNTGPYCFATRKCATSI